MTSNNSKEVLPTIYSRTQRIEMRRLSDDIIASFLETKYSVGSQDAISLAHLAEGSIVHAEKLISVSDENKLFFDMFVQLMRLAYQRKVKDLKMWSENVAGFGREQAMRFLAYCQRLIRENFIYNLNLPQINYLNAQEAEFSRNFARFITERNVEKLIEVLNKALVDISSNANSKIVFFDTAIKVIFLLKSDK